MNTTQDTQDCIDVCNDLLRGELSAIEAYSTTIHQFPEEREILILKNIRSEHIDSANRLRHNVQEMGGEPDQSSGGWGTLTQAIQGTAVFFGERSALKSLRQGEEIGKGQYESALGNDAVMESCKEMIRGLLLPRVEGHILMLDSLERRK